MVCNRDCFNCEFNDCIQERMTNEERIEINGRDKAIAGVEKTKNLGNSWYARNREKVIERSKKRYREHKQEVLDAQKRRRMLHRDKGL